MRKQLKRELTVEIRASQLQHWVYGLHFAPEICKRRSICLTADSTAPEPLNTVVRLVIGIDNPSAVLVEICLKITGFACVDNR